MPKVTKNCEQCQKEYTRFPCEVGRFCSPKCNQEWQKTLTPWNKGIKTGKPAWNRGLSNTWALGEKNPRWNGGKKKCIDCSKQLSKRGKLAKRCFSCNKAWQRGENIYNWKGGLKPSRANFEYKTWAKAIYKRDHYHCAMCSKHCNGDINAHHIIRYIDAPEFRHELCNGITLCFECHLKTRGKEEYYAPLFLNVLATREREDFIWKHN